MAGLSRAEESWLWVDGTGVCSCELRPPESTCDPEAPLPLPCGDSLAFSFGIDVSRAGDVEGEMTGEEDAEEGEEEEEEELDREW